MFKRYLCQLLVLALLSPAASFALGLGEIHLKSALDAPLDAEIDIVGATPEDLSGLKAQLAPRDAFTRAGLDYPAYFSGLKLTPEKASDGRNVLHVHSVESVTEPFATLLIEADWPRGHVVREYTVLIDPPVFSNTQNPNNAAVAAPATGGGTRSGNVEHTTAGTSAAAATAAGAAAATAGTSGRNATARSSGTTNGGSAAATEGPTAAGGTYTVHRGDTLSSVAAQNYPGSDHTARERQLVGIYRANPSAFEGNMNLLRSGSQLQLPGDAELQAISPGEASSEIHKQYQAWNGAHNGAGGAGQLHLVPPQETGNAAGNAAPSAGGAAAGTIAAGAGSKASGENAALSQRVQQLEAQLAEQQRLLQARNDELAQLQARAAQSKTPPASSTPTNVPPTNVPPTNVPPAASAPPPSAPAPTQNATPAPPAVVPAPAPTPAPPIEAAKPPVAAPAPASTGATFLELLGEYWLWLVLLAVLIVAAILGLRYMRSRQEEEFDRSLGRLHPAFEGTQTSSALRSVDTMPVRTLPATSGGEQSYRVEESGVHEQPTAVLHDRTGEVPSLTSTEHVVIDDTVTGEHPVGLDQGDPLAEADFHMAYGLYDQAADLVQIAMSREPNRRDLKLKLLEVFFVWGNKDRFLQTARELASSREQALPGEWEKVVIMGRQIAPEDPLFEGASGLGAAASGGVDLNLEGGQNRVDFDLLGEPTASHEPGNVGLDLDLGAALGDTQIRNEPDKSGESGVDFVLDDPERGNDATGSTREMPEAPPRPPSGATATMQIINSGNAPSDAPTVERQQLEGVENNTIREKLGAATRAGLTSASDQTAELALDDLGLDLGSLEGTGDETIMQGGPDAPTMLASMDEESRRRLSGAADEEDQERTQVTPTPPSTSESGTWLFTDSDLTDLVPEEERHRFDEDHAGSNPTEVITQITPPPSIDPGATGRIQALDSSGLDLDLGNLEEHKDANGIDLDVGTPSAGETGTFVQTQRIAQSEMPLPELEPATMSEVGTKLDLARAYMDMGDPEGARSILAEVLSEGSVSQKQEARRLMDTLPG